MSIRPIANPMRHALSYSSGSEWTVSLGSYSSGRHALSYSSGSERTVSLGSYSSGSETFDPAVVMGTIGRAASTAKDGPLLQDHG